MASANNYGVFPLRGYVVTFEKFENSEWSCRNERGHIERHFSEIFRMEPVDVLAWIDRHQYLLSVDLFWQRKLNDEAVDIVVVVELADLFEQFSFRGCAWHFDQRRFETDTLARLTLTSDIG